jgi:hypothetical protein
MVINMRSGIKKNYILICFKILNLKGHQSYITGSRVTAIFLNGLIFPIGQSSEASQWRVCYQRGLPRLAKCNGMR